jgi:cell division protease FtsH
MRPDEERHTLTEEYLQTQMTVFLGGRASEQILLGSVSSGAEDDIQQATRLARAMVARWGMSDEIGPIDLRDSEDHPFLGREMAQPRRFADQTAARVDEAVKQRVLAAELEARHIIEKQRRAIEALIKALESRETLDAGEIEAILGPGAHAAAGKSAVA